MPKLRETRLDEYRQLIEQAALSLLPSRDSMKTNIRDSAAAASVATGKINTYHTPPRRRSSRALCISREAAMSLSRQQRTVDLMTNDYLHAQIGCSSETPVIIRG